MKYLQLSDEELVSCVIMYEQLEAFEELYDRYHQKIYNKCLAFVDSPDKAEDLTHDIFLKTFINLKEADHISNFRIWFYALVYDMCLEYAHVHLSQNQKAYWEFDRVERTRIKVFHCDSEDRLLQLDVQKLKEVLKKLPPEDRLILLMKYQDSMNLGTIAELLNTSTEDIQIRLNLARERAMAVYDKLITHYQTNGQPKVTKSVSRA